MVFKAKLFSGLKISHEGEPSAGDLARRPAQDSLDLAWLADLADRNRGQRCLTG
jgi:hypothetical protein